MGIISSLVVATALSFSKPIPANDYHSWYSEEIAKSIMMNVVSNEYYPHLDFNGDNELSVVDAVAVRKRYLYNKLNGNTMHFGESDVMEIIVENFRSEEYDEYFYYEIDFVNGECGRAYEMDFSEITSIHVYIEMNNEVSGFDVIVNPIEEIYSVN